MRNRAKCKLCFDIIESFMDGDRVNCKCGEIAIDGGKTAYKVYAKDFNNLLRIDDQNNEIIPKIQSDTIAAKPQPEGIFDNPPTHKELIDLLDGMIQGVESLPEHAMSSPISH